MDLNSRKIIANEVWEEENAEHSKTLLNRSALRENIAQQSTPLILHGDNGSPIKAGTVQATMLQLGITPSYSRPRVSNDNAHAEALFRTAKYHPTLPEAFKDLEEARAWSQQFVDWYNNEHLHSALKFITPAQKHAGEDIKIQATRNRVYHEAREKNPARWIQKKTRDWTSTTETSLNPIDLRKVEKHQKKVA